mgnify:CR=1 FL=1
MQINSHQSRRKFLTALPLATLAACENSGNKKSPSVQTRKHLKWRMVTTWPKDFPGLGTGANYLAQLIGEMSNGELEIKVYGAGELVPALGVFDAVAGGTAEMGHSTAYYWKGKHEATQFFSTVPFRQLISPRKLAIKEDFGFSYSSLGDPYCFIEPFSMIHISVAMLMASSLS